MANSLFKPKIIFYLLSLILISILLSFFVLQILLILLSAMCLLDLIVYRKIHFDSKGSVIILALLASKIISSSLSDYSSISLSALFKEIFFFLSYFAFTHYLYFMNEERKLLLLKTFVYSGLLVALIGIIKYNLGSLRAESITSGSATFSVFITVLTGIIILLKDKLLLWKNTFTEILLITILLSATTLTFAKANIIISLLILFTCLMLRKIKWGVVIVSLVLTAVIVLFSMNINSKYFRNNLQDENYLFSNRDLIWKGAYSIALEKPLLGHGVGTFKETYPFWNQLKDKGVGNWHNQLIQIYMETGVIGLFIFLLLIYYLYKSWYLMQQIKNKDDYSLITNSLIVGITSLLLTSLATNFISSVILSIVFTFLFSLFLSYRKLRYDSNQ
jgi:O-antigen ligase